MSTNARESQDFLRLFKCVVDTGADVLVPFTKNKLLTAYNGNFERFLDDKKHELFHLWHSKKLLCCACPPAGCILKRTGHMDNWIFKKMYDDSGCEEGGHITRKNGKVEQLCVHKYVTRNIAIHELDIIALSFLLRNLANLLQKETDALDTIRTNRSMICHAYSTNCFDMALLNKAWSELDTALVNLTDPSYKVVIKKQIQYLRMVEIEKEEITELLTNVEEANKILQELKSATNNNVSHFKGMEMRLVDKVNSSTQHITEQTSLAATTTQHALSEKIQNTGSKVESCIKHEVAEVRESQANNFQDLGNKLQETMTDISIIREVTKNQEKTQGEILRTIQNLKLFVKYEIPANILVPEEPEETCTDSQESPVLWQIATPKNWNLELVEATLRNPSNKDELFKKKFVRKGSLIMLTTIAAGVLRDEEAFEAAVMSLLTKMIEDCGINTEIPDQVDVTLHILNVNEVSLSCEVPSEVRPLKVTGNTKQLIENEKFDVAFLNGDDEKEIGWVNNMSRTLKTRYDMKCSILAQDFLNGFPLKQTLSMYVNMFQAVILTLTKENHQQYDFYIKDDMPVIAVELDYLNEIRLNLRSFPYINCTTCEHLWFPLLLNTLKTEKIPDHVREIKENDRNEINKDCGKCDTTVTTAVYHRVEFRNTIYKKQLTLCGSIMDEPLILNILRQMTNCREPYKITSWKKSLETPVGLTTHSVFILISPNIQKCQSLESYANAIIKSKVIELCALMIADTEMPFVLRLKEERPHYTHVKDPFIDASSMDLKQMADVIFLSVKNINIDKKENTRESHESMRKVRSGKPDLNIYEEDRLIRSHESMRKVLYGKPDINIDKKENTRESHESIRKVQSGQPDDSVYDIQSLEISELRMEKKQSWPSDLNIYEKDIVIGSHESMRKVRSGKSDDSADDIRDLTHSDLIVNREPFLLSDDSIFKSSDFRPHSDFRKKRAHSWLSDYYVDDTESMTDSELSIKKENSWPSDINIDEKESPRESNESMMKGRSGIPDDSVDEIEILKESDTSMNKEESEREVASIEEGESLKKPRFPWKKEKAERPVTVGSIEEGESLKKPRFPWKKEKAERSDGLFKKLNMRQTSVGIADQSGDETEILRNSDTSMNIEKSERTGSKKCILQ